MILSDYENSIKIFSLLQKLDQQELNSESRELLSELESTLLQFKCPSCQTPIGVCFNRHAWETAYLNMWSAQLKKDLSFEEATHA